MFDAGEPIPVTYDDEVGMRTDLGLQVVLLRLIGDAGTAEEFLRRADQKFKRYSDLLRATSLVLGAASILYGRHRADFFSPQP